MAINLTENVKTYLTYAGTAITSAAVGALILLAGQGINNWRHPKAITDDMLLASQDANVAGQQEQLNTLNGQTAQLNQAQTTARTRVKEAQAAVDGAGEGGPTAEQTEELTAAQQALAAATEALRNHNAQITKLQAQIAVNGVLANADQRAELVKRINNLAPVPRT